MPLDPPIAAILDMFAQMGNGGLSSGTAEKAREMFDVSTVTMRDPSTLAQVRSTEDITIPGPAGPIAARVYRPDVDGAVPTMAFFHGGGFVIGNLETHDDQVRLICRDAAMVVVSIDYRLAPEHPFPAAFEDCVAATEWVAANVATLGGDADRVVVGGDSAGGNLSAAISLATRESGPKLAAQLLIYPAVDFDEDADYPSRVDNATGYLLTADDMVWFVEQYVPGEIDHTDPRLSPLHAASLAGSAAGGHRYGGVRPAARRGRGLRQGARRRRCRGSAPPLRRPRPRLLRARRLQPRRRRCRQRPDRLVQRARRLGPVGFRRTKIKVKIKIEPR